MRITPKMERALERDEKINKVLIYLLITTNISFVVFWVCLLSGNKTAMGTSLLLMILLIVVSMLGLFIRDFLRIKGGIL